MRLIDIEALRDAIIHAGILENRTIDSILWVCEKLDLMPVTYDVSIVLERLERELPSLIIGDGYNADARRNKILEIIKEGLPSAEISEELE